jgi:hypothetical protein
MEEQPGEVTAFEGATKEEQQLLHQYAKIEHHLFHTGRLTSILGREISEDSCDTRSIGDNRDSMRRVAEKLDYVLLLLRQALTLYDQLGRHIRIFQGIWAKRCKLDLLYQHLSSTQSWIMHHWACDFITDQLLKVIADDLIYKSKQVEAWAKSLEFTLECIYRYRQERETSDDTPGENLEDPMESVAPTDSIAMRTRSHYPK